MKKTVTIALVIALAVTVIGGAAFAAFVDLNPDVFVGRAFVNTHDGLEMWVDSKVEAKYGYEEIRHLAMNHTVYVIHTDGVDGIGIELIEDEVLLVIQTADARLINDLGPYHIWF